MDTEITNQLEGLQDIMRKVLLLTESLDTRIHQLPFANCPVIDAAHRDAYLVFEMLAEKVRTADTQLSCLARSISDRICDDNNLKF